MVLTQYGTIESAVEATCMGAADYVTKLFHIPELRGKLELFLMVEPQEQRFGESIRVEHVRRAAGPFVSNFSHRRRMTPHR